MSVDYAFWESTEPLENEEAGQIYVDLLEGRGSDRVQPSPKIALLARRIESLWPTPAPGEEDDWVFASPHDEAEKYLAVAMVPSRAWNEWWVLRDLAHEYELVMYDPQIEHVYLPRRLSQKRTRARAKKKREERE